MEEIEARKKWRSGLSCKSQPLLHGGALGEAHVWRWSGIWETHAGRSAAVKMIMASQITGPHLSSSNSLSNHTALHLQQPTPSSYRVSVEPTRRNCPAYRAGKAPPSTSKYNYSLRRMRLVEGIVWMDWDHSIFWDWTIQFMCLAEYKTWANYLRQDHQSCSHSHACKGWPFDSTDLVGWNGSASSRHILFFWLEPFMCFITKHVYFLNDPNPFMTTLATKCRSSYENQIIPQY